MSTKHQVLRAYRNLIRASQEVFRGDLEALGKSRVRIRESFLEKRNLGNVKEILEQVKIANETSEFLLQGVVQGKLEPNTNIYKVRITENTKLHENVPLKDCNKVSKYS